MEPLKQLRQEANMGPLEAAFNWSENAIDNRWFARVTWKCPMCGRRNVVLEKGPGRMPVPLKVRCKLGHETVVVPYRQRAKVEGDGSFIAPYAVPVPWWGQADDNDCQQVKTSFR
jgi:hypothetical protein